MEKRTTLVDGIEYEVTDSDAEFGRCLFVIFAGFLLVPFAFFLAAWMALG